MELNEKSILTRATFDNSIATLQEAEMCDPFSPIHSGDFSFIHHRQHKDSKRKFDFGTKALRYSK